MQKLGHKQSSAAKRAFLHSVNMVTEVSPVTVVSLEDAGDLDMKCCVCEIMGQDFRRGLERPC